jgi:hypothetical protein
MVIILLSYSGLQLKEGLEKYSLNNRLSINFKYSLFNNCEHLTSEVLTERPTSAQLKTSLTVSLIGTALVALKSENRNMQILSIAALCFGLFGLYIEKQKQLSS